MKTLKVENLEKNVESLRCRLSEIEQLTRKRDLDVFTSSGGCNECAGRGWIVSWDTLDCMHGSYAQYASCPNERCTRDTRKASGLKPVNTKYDKLQGTVYSPSYTDDESSEICDINLQITDLKRLISEENARWSVCAGKIVEVKRPMRGKKAKRVPIGTTGIVQKVWTSSWGSQKAIVLDKDGKKWWPTIKSIDVVDPDPDMSEWNSVLEKDRASNGIPIVATIKAKSSKAALLLTTTGKEFWVPMSQAADLKEASKGETVSTFIPIWVAKKSNII